MKKLLAFVLLLVVLIGRGQVPSPKPNTYVNDFVGKLSQEQVYKLNERILSIEKKSSVQIAIVLIDKVPEGKEIEDYAREIGRTWHVGNAHNGLVYVAAISDRKMRLEVAEKLEGDIPDVEASSITSDMKPFFKQEDYYGGFNALLDGIWKRVNPVAKEQLRLQALEDRKREAKFQENFRTVAMWFLSILFILGVPAIFIYRNYDKKKKAKEERLRKIEEEKEKERQRKDKEVRDKIYQDSLRKRKEEKADLWKFRPNQGSNQSTNRTSLPIIPIIPIVTEQPKPKKKEEEDTSSSYNSSSSSSSSSRSDDTPSYGNWGSGSSDTNDTSSGFSGGGSTDSW